MPVFSRPCAGEADFALLRRVAEHARMPGNATYYTPGELDWCRRIADDDPLPRARLWIDESPAGSEPVGFAWPDGDQFDLVALPGGPALLPAMLDWIEAPHADCSGAAGSRSLGVWALDTDTPRADLLRERGYVPTEEHYVCRQRALSAGAPAPTLPPGYAFRPAPGLDDAMGIEQRVAVHRSAFTPSRMTVAKHRAVIASPTYRPDLDLLVAGPDGELAAYAIAWYDAASRAGIFEPVGCGAGHRRRGLGRAILFEGMRRLRDLGASIAEVRSEPRDESPAANALYDSAGLREIDRLRLWRLEIR